MVQRWVARSMVRQPLQDVSRVRQHMYPLCEREGEMRVAVLAVR